MNKQTNFDLILFGATGDLAMRKLLPCLYQAHAAGLLHPEGRILGVSRSRFTTAEFLAKVETDAKIHIKTHFDADLWQSFIHRIQYLPVNVAEGSGFDELAVAVKSRTNTESIVVYLSTAPKFFAAACAQLAAVGLNHDKVCVVLEKPLGTDLVSCRKINEDVARHFRETQIYRIDHYLGKESLQNLLVLRFGNRMFEPFWNNRYVKSVQITIAETLGVEERGEFYDVTGALRDMVQNHIIQMLCFTAMECPKSLAADDVRDEKLNVLQALKPLNDVAHQVVRAQYATSDSHTGYLNEHKVPSDSQTETYVAIRAEIDNERWRGVPFYLRTGKRMAGKTAEIVLSFKPEHNLFGNSFSHLVITLQPEETVKLRLLAKQPGNGIHVVPAEMVLDLAHANRDRRAEAYELLLREVIDGRLNLFNRRDELEAAWAWVMPILDNWAAGASPLHTYPAGSWGPQAAADLLTDTDDVWHENAETVQTD